jgi:uncharacterized protein (DUF2384 family)
MSVNAPIRHKPALGPAGLRSFFRIAEQWQLSTDEQMKLLNVPPSTFHGWKAKPGVARLHHDTLERISYILGIYKNLHILLGDKTSADNWIRRPNKAILFGGHSAIERMTSGNVSDLFVVRRYLDAQVRG